MVVCILQVMWYNHQSGTVYMLHTSQQIGRGQGTSRVIQLVSHDQGVTWYFDQQPVTSQLASYGSFLRNHALEYRSAEHNVAVDEAGHVYHARVAEEQAVLQLLLPVYFTPRGIRVSHAC